MSRELTHDEIKEQAASYALGALDREEALAFEKHIAGGCEACQAELREFDQVAGQLAYAAGERAPRLAIRERLLNRIAEGAAKESNEYSKSTARPQLSLPILSIRADEGEWREITEGVLMKQLYQDKATGIATSLVKMMPGTSLPVHKHSGVEQLFILEGDCHVQGEMLGPGDYHRAEAGSIHRETFTVEGTLFLLIAPTYYEVLQSDT